MRLRKTILMIIGLLPLFVTTGYAQTATVAGLVVDQKGRPLEYASVLLKECALWAVSDANGAFIIKQVPHGRQTLTVQCLGYAKESVELTVTKDVGNLKVVLTEDNLKLSGVEVVAQRRQDEATTSYTIDRNTLDHQQTLNVTDILTLLPGGKTQNSTLMSDDRLALRSGAQEKGNAAFGTAIELDGQRLDNNSMMGETMSSSTRNISTSNIGSVEIVTGIASVEYGDLSNGVVKINTRRGKSPFIIEASLNPNTRHVALNKGLDLGRRKGLLNLSAEHTRSFSDIASPYTSYQRNVLTLHYMNTLMSNSHPLTLNAGVTGNVGGYNSKGDPDQMLDSYAKVRDNMLSGNVELSWLLNLSWLTNLSFAANFSMQDKRSEDYYNTASASAQPYIHTTNEGYYIAQDYDELLSKAISTAALNAIILGPTGYWYVRRYGDQKPTSYKLKGKADWTRRFGADILCKLLVGADYSGAKNRGRGIYYDDMRLAPTWREYRYDQLPSMNNLAVYAEQKLTVPTTHTTGDGGGTGASLQLTAGVRSDFTMISRSDYGNVSSLSPRFNGRYVFWQGKQQLVSHLEVHAGWGRGVKLPSFQVLYPAPSYADYLSFTPGSTADNRAFYAYYTYPSKALYNAALRWQFTDQTDVGFETRIGGVKLSLSAFYHKTCRSYMSVVRYTPFQYKTTGQEAVVQSGVANADRSYAIDPATGIVTLYDQSGKLPPQQLDFATHNAYNQNCCYTNGTPVERYGLEWVVDFVPRNFLLRSDKGRLQEHFSPLTSHFSLRLDGNYYRYRAIDETLFAGAIAGIGDMTTDTAYPLIGYYRGSSATSAGTAATASIANGSEAEQVNLNATLTTHLPRVRMIVTLRLESSIYNYRRSLSELSSGTRGILLNDVADYFGQPYTKDVSDHYVAVYPEFYSTWDQPDLLIPFAERLAWAHENDRNLYNQLARLVVKSNYAYTMNPNRLSPYLSANFSVTKEIGDHVSISFYANNFFNNMGHVRSSQTHLKASLFDSGYIPRFYYGMSVRVKM